MRVHGRHDVIRVINDTFFLYFQLENDPFLLFFLHDINYQIVSIIMEQQMHHQLGIPMKMSVHWGWRISFVFEQFTTMEEDVGWIILGMIVTIIISALSVTLPAVKSKIANKLFGTAKNSSIIVKETENQSDENIDEEQPRSMKEHLFSFFYIFTYSCLHILTMMLIMTYNGYVIIAVIAGLTLGYTLFGMEADKDKNIPVNCCA